LRLRYNIENFVKIKTHEGIIAYGEIVGICSYVLDSDREDMNNNTAGIKADKIINLINLERKYLAGSVKKMY